MSDVDEFTLLAQAALRDGAIELSRELSRWMGARPAALDDPWMWAMIHKMGSSELAGRLARRQRLNDKIFIAERRSSAQLLDVALSLGADIDAKDNAGLTALMRAVAGVDASFVEALLARGARLDMLAPGSHTAVDLARREHVGRDGAGLGHVGADILLLLESAAEARAIATECQAPSASSGVTSRRI